MAEKVEVISSSLIGATATAPSISRLELLPWDLRILRAIPTQRGLIFHNPNFQSKQILIQNLKNSLSRTLDFFPPLAGRLVATPHGGGMASFFVDCNNAGAEFTHAVASAVSVSDIIEPSYIPEIVSHLIPLNGATNYDGISKPLLAVQVTELADGIFIGCAANHAVVDGTSFWHFFKSWSEISRGSDKISKFPVFDRPAAAAAADNRLVHLPSLEKNLIAPPSQKLPQKVFQFSKEKLGQLKAKANSEAGTSKISTLQALSAHLWRSIIRSQSQTTTDSTNRVIIVSIGARARVSWLPDGYFGNAFYSAVLAVSAAELLQKGLGAAALRINELIREQTDEVIARDAEKKVEFQRMGMVKGMGSGAPLMIGGSHRHDVYGCDFGWGKPVGVRTGKGRKFEGLAVLSPAAEGGIVVEICLIEETLRAMECDAEFTAMLR